jgi:hypothetical protein
MERGVHVVETHPLGDERVDIDAAAEIAVGELWSLFATARAAERRALYAPALEQPARDGVDRLPLALCLGASCTLSARTASVRGSP